MGLRAGASVLSTAILALACAEGGEGAGDAPHGSLDLRILDASSGRPLPARVELLDADGAALVPDGALPIRRAECFDALIPDWLEGPRETTRLFDPYAETTQFYVDGRLETALPSGSYRIRAFQGIEFEVARAEIEVRPDRPARVALRLARWIDLPAEGWLGADAHLHISRAGPRDDAALERWMSAEGLHVASLLQGGNATSFDITPQYAFGAEGAHRGSGTLLLSGQEHPRTHLLGHTIILGGSSAIDLRDAYLLHERFAAEAARQGALFGYAHWGLGAGRLGLAIDAPSGRVSFVEVLGFDYAHYATWYDLLDLGLRVTPTAGTDYPCNPYTIPGRDRFYTRVDGGRDAAAWLAGVRAGRTFVTNGPALDLEVAGAGIGERATLAAPGVVEIVGRARFDAARDDVRALELVRAGEVVDAARVRRAPGILELRARLHVDETTWFALRARGVKRGEGVPPRASASTRLVARLLPKVQGGAPFAERFARDALHWPSAAHTAAVYVEVAGSRPLAEQPAAAAVAERWRARLDGLRERLAPDRLAEIPIWSVPTGDGVPLHVLERDREGLLRAVDRAAGFYERRRR